MATTDHTLAFSQGFAQVEALHAALCGLLDGPPPAEGVYRLDGSDVEQLDLSTLQVLAAFVRDAREAGHDVTWAGTSRRVREAARVTGLTEALALPGEV